MNPYEISRETTDGIRQLLETTDTLREIYELSSKSAEVFYDLRANLLELQQEHSKSWQLLKRNDERMNIITARLESMDILCGQLVPLLELAKKSNARQGDRKLKRLYSQQKYGCCKSFVEDEGTVVSGVANIHLRRWLDEQEAASEFLASQAFGVLPRLAMITAGYQKLGKVIKTVSEFLLKGEFSVILVYGLPGIGKTALADYMTANPPSRFSDGAMKVEFGEVCSMAACGHVRKEYERVLASKLCFLLRELVYEASESLTFQDAWAAVTDALKGTSFLVVLDDVWESEILDMFEQLEPNGCRYLVTSRENLVSSSAKVHKVRIGTRVIRSASKAIFKYHVGLPAEFMPFPDSARQLLEHCNHHPFAVAVLGEALRGANWAEDWRCANKHFIEYNEGANQKSCQKGRGDTKWLRAAFGAFEFSLSRSTQEVKFFFTILAAISWLKPVPAACLKVLWETFGWGGPFLLQARELIRRCLLKRSHNFLFYEVRGLVQMYMKGKVEEAIQLLLQSSQPPMKAMAAPWLFIFGVPEARDAAAKCLDAILVLEDESLQSKVLLTAVDVVKVCGKERGKANRDFALLVRPQIVGLLSRSSVPTTHAAIAKFIAMCFEDEDYNMYGHVLVTAGLITNLLPLLSIRLGMKMLVKNDVINVLFRLAMGRDKSVIETMLNANVLGHLISLLEPNSEWLHEDALKTIDTLAETGELAIEQILNSPIIEKLLVLLDDRKAAVRCRSLKAFLQLIKFGGNNVVMKALHSGLLEKLDASLPVPSEEIQIWTCDLCLQLCAIGQDAYVSKVASTNIMENLSQLLLSSSEKIRTLAVKVLWDLVVAMGKVASERITRAGGTQSLCRLLHTGLESHQEGIAHSLYSLIVNDVTPLIAQ